MRPELRHRIVGTAAVGLALLGWLVLLGPRSGETAQSEQADATVGTGPTAGVRQRRATGSISGAVTASDGKTLANVRVCAAHVTSHLLGHVQSVCASSRSDGTYMIAELDPGAYDVSAIASGYMPAAVDKARHVVVMPGLETKAVNFMLIQGGARLVGTVQDTTGGPIAQASIALWFGSPLTIKATVQSDAEGRFEAWVTPGPVGVTAHANGYTEALIAHVAPSSDLVIRMSPGSTITGSVVSFDRGEPVPGVEVRAICDRCFDSAASPAAISGADGRFRIENLASASYSLRAEGDGWMGGARDLVSVGIAQTVSDAVVYVAPTMQVSGKVLQANGEPCVRGTVQLGPAQPAGPLRSGPPSEASALPVLVAGLGESGDVHFRSVPAGTYSASVHCEDHVLVDGPSMITVGDEAVTRLVWHVRPGLQLTVHVVDALGRPRPNTYFFFVTPGRTQEQPAMNYVLMTDANGRHELQRNLVAGRYEIQPYQAEGDPVAVELHEGMGPAEATLRLRGTGSIEVTVRTADGTPVDSVRVVALAAAPPQALAAVDGEAAAKSVVERRANARDASALGLGRFQFASVRPGAYDIEVDDGLNAPTVRAVHVADQPVHETIVLDRDHTIVGRVVDSDGDPQPDVWVSATCATASSPEPEAQTDDLAVQILRETKRVVSDAEGRFTLTGVSRAAASCTVRAEHPGSSIAEKQGVVPGHDTVLSMVAFGGLRGTARDAGGRAVTEFVINVITGDDQRRSRTELITSSNGEWSLPRVIPGKSTITARTRAGETAELSLEVLPGETIGGLQLLFTAAPAPAPLLAN